MAGEPKPLRFGREMRLKQSRDFARVRQEGRRMVCGCFIANWRVLPPGSGMKLGVITAKKLGGAVVRTRARRLLREVFRLHQHDFLQPVELVLVAQRTIVDMGLRDVEEAFLTMLRKGRLLKTE
ncbi:MAG TPA: ribonuclease P protein component [Verrucomicrobiae bacterium]|nr:ribonuclease P protein component [Verrucomicrobiae bacterium]